MEKVQVFGASPSPFVNRVIWAAKLKGIQFNYIEEDLTNKSSLLVQYNPVHKKVPVLVHNGKPICESLVILEYLEEAWPHQYSLLPIDPYERAMVRFWAKFADDKGLAIWIMFRTTGEELDKARKDCLDMLKIIEEHLHGLGNKKFFGGEKIGMADLAFASVFYWLEVIEKIVEVKILEHNTFPNIYKWSNNFKEVPIIKNNFPDQYQMFTFLKNLREMILATVST